jgi:hypothetical protein
MTKAKKNDLSDLTLDVKPEDIRRAKEHNFLFIIAIIAIISLVALAAVAISLTQRQVVGKAFAVSEDTPVDTSLNKLQRNWCFHSNINEADPSGYEAYCTGVCKMPKPGFDCVITG